MSAHVLHLSYTCFVQGVKSVCDVLLRVAEMAWDVLSRV